MAATSACLHCFVRALALCGELVTGAVAFDWDPPTASGNRPRPPDIERPGDISPRLQAMSQDDDWDLVEVVVR